MEQILLAQLAQARSNLGEAVSDNDYAEAAVWSYKIEALEDALAEASVHKQHDNVVDIHG